MAQGHSAYAPTFLSLDVRATQGLNKKRVVFHPFFGILESLIDDPSFLEKDLCR